MRLYQILEKTVAACPDLPATANLERNRTWTQVRDDAVKTAGALASLGIERGNCVAVLAFNGERWMDLYFGCWRIGGVIVPLNLRLSLQELTDQLEDCGARVLVTDASHDALGAKLCAKIGLRHVSLDDENPMGGTPLMSALCQNASPVEDCGAGGLDPAGVFYTGGTTGRPKGVVTTHQSFYLHILASGLGPTGEGGALLHTAPVFHVSGAGSLVSGVWRAIPQVFMDKFEPKQALELIEAHRPTSLVLAPVMIQRLLDHPDFATTDLSSLTTLIYGSAPMPESLLRRAIQLLPKASFLQGYGMTEVCGAVSNLAAGDHDPDGAHPERLRSAGRPTLLAEIRIVDEAGSDVAPGDVGEVWVRSPTMMLGYLNQPEETAKVLQDGWYRSGDGGRLDKDGYLYIVDRLKDMIVTGGENVYCVEVETALISHPAVAQAVVYGVPDDEWGERVHAEALLQPGAAISPEELISHCRDQVAGYKIPRSIVIRSEPFPTTPAGKIQKSLLRAVHWEGRERAVN